MSVGVWDREVAIKILPTAFAEFFGQAVVQQILSSSNSHTGILHWRRTKEPC